MEKKKTNFWMYGFFILLGIIGGIFYSNFSGGSWDETGLTRMAIEDYDIVLKYIDEGKYEEASNLANTIGHILWYLRNSKDTGFYDELEFWSIDSMIKYSPEQTKSKIKNVQEKLCPKSDISRYNLDKEISNKYEWKESYIEENARC